MHGYTNNKRNNNSNITIDSNIVVDDGCDDDTDINTYNIHNSNNYSNNNNNINNTNNSTSNTNHTNNNGKISTKFNSTKNKVKVYLLFKTTKGVWVGHDYQGMMVQIEPMSKWEFQKQGDEWGWNMVSEWDTENGWTMVPEGPARAA